MKEGKNQGRRNFHLLLFYSESFILNVLNIVIQRLYVLSDDVFFAHVLGKVLANNARQYYTLKNSYYKPVFLIFHLLFLRIFNQIIRICERISLHSDLILSECI